MKILSWNVNGLRSVYKKGFIQWLEDSKADVVCLQEIKAQESQLTSELLQPIGYHSYFNTSNKKGYSGVAIYSKEKPLEIEKTIGLTRFDQEGRMLRLDFPTFFLFNVYLPHGGRQKENLDYKLQVYSTLFNYLDKVRDERTILIGDFNIAHKEIDLARPNQNKKNIMFTQEERRQIDMLIELGFVDTFRQFNQESGNYTWLSYFPQARERGLGWRIDYAFISQKMKPKLINASIFSEVRGSDHCPIGIEVE